MFGYCTIICQHISGVTFITPSAFCYYICKAHTFSDVLCKQLINKHKHFFGDFFTTLLDLTGTFAIIMEAL
jgi:hypothetical protein